MTQFRDELSLNRITQSTSEKEMGWDSFIDTFILLLGHWWCERHNFSKYDIQNYKLVNDKSRSETDKTLIRADKSLGSVCHNVITVWISLNISDIIYHNSGTQNGEG